MNAPSPRLSDRQRINWLRLIRTSNVGPATFRDLINRFGSAEAAIEMLPELTASGGALRAVRIPSVEEAESEINAATVAGARFVAIGEADYPPMLRRMDQPPPLVAIKGEAAVFRLPAVAIVGARNASLAGIKMARVLASELGREGYAIASGFARGIDTAAHEASLATGTIAAFAGGIDQPYPPDNAALVDDVVANRGALISEMPMGWEPRAKDFPRRNRIIAGMTLATVVVEAAERSGSLITARLALEQNREVLAVPGSPLDPRAAGSNNLLKQGARLATNARDVIDAVAPMLDREPEAPPGLFATPAADVPEEPAQDERARVVEALGPSPVDIDSIIRFTGVPARIVQVVLLELELAGRIERHPGQRVSLR